MTTILPAVAEKTGLVTVNTLPRSDKEMNLNGAANQFNLEVNAYVGGIVGYNDAETRLTIRSATNGSQSNAASVGSLKMRGETGTLGSGVSLQDYNNSFNYNAYAGGKDARGYMAGGIIGCVTQNTTLEAAPTTALSPTRARRAASPAGMAAASKTAIPTPHWHPAGRLCLPWRHRRHQQRDGHGLGPGSKHHRARSVHHRRRGGPEPDRCEHKL